MNPPPVFALSPKKALLYATAAVGSFHLAYAGIGLNFLILAYLYCLLRLAELGTWMRVFYFAMGAALLVFAPQLGFFWTIFGFLGVALWLVASFWVALFVVLAHRCLRRFGRVGLACAAPFLWTGLEYFRSELYYLRFSWLNFGYAFSDAHKLHLLAGLGVYGMGFAGMAVVAGLYLLPCKARIFVVSALVAALIFLPVKPPDAEGKALDVAGVQLEFPTTAQVIAALDTLDGKYPQTDLFVLSENTFPGAVPENVKEWCRVHQKYLVAGGRDFIPGGDQYYNTAFVVGPKGDIVFQQAKSVPVQFFDDGLPAKEQRVWDSPWGKIGLGICYDAGYRRVDDELIRQGAQALIFPTMDEKFWGAHEHRLGTLVARMRAAEYGVPVFRLASSGISELIDANGRMLVSADYSGQGEMIEGEIMLPAQGHLPPDRWLAPFCAGVTGLLAVWMVGGWVMTKLRTRKNNL